MDDEEVNEAEEDDEEMSEALMARHKAGRDLYYKVHMLINQQMMDVENCTYTEALTASTRILAGLIYIMTRDDTQNEIQNDFNRDACLGYVMRDLVGVIDDIEANPEQVVEIPKSASKEMH